MNTINDADQLPPHDIAAEQMALGCILCDPKVGLPLATAMLQAEDFFDSRHQLIYSKMIELTEKRIEVNTATLFLNLRGAEPDDQVLACYLSDLEGQGTSAYGVEYFAEKVAEKAIARGLIACCTRSISLAAEGGSPQELLSQVEQDLRTVQRPGRAQAPSLRETEREFLERVERRKDDRLGGIPTGFVDLDRAHDGMHEGEMIVIAGFPGSGKTSLAMNIVEHAVFDLNLPVAVFSFEMPGVQLFERIVASRCRINLRSGNVNEAKIREEASRVGGSRLFIEEASGWNIDQVRTRARELKTLGVKLWLVDYVQIVGASSGIKDTNREQIVASISHSLKQMTGEFKDPLLALSQLNDEGQLRESRAIGQDADSVWQLETKDDADPDPTAAEQVKLRIKKQRNGPSPVVIRLTFFKSFTRFESAAKITRQDEQDVRNWGYKDN